MSDDIVFQPLPLVWEVNSSEISRNFSQEFSSTSSSGIFKPIVLQNDEPNERYKVNYDNVWPHQVKHVLLGLHVVHQGRHEEEHKTCAAHKVPLVSHILGI